MEEPEVRIKPKTGVGRDLYQLSVAELEHFIAELEAEIAGSGPRSRASATCAVRPRRCFAGPPGGPEPD